MSLLGSHLTLSIQKSADYEKIYTRLYEFGDEAESVNEFHIGCHLQDLGLQEVEEDSQRAYSESIT